jgi:type VI secretion system secreted protein Hcp
VKVANVAQKEGNPMAEMFLDLEGVEGESQDFQYAGKIEIKAWDWEIENKVHWDQNQGGQSTKTTLSAVQVQKTCDKASIILSQNCTNGKHFPQAIIHCRKNNGDSKLEYVKFTMTDVMISKIHWTGNGDETSLSEVVHLEFAQYVMDYTLQSDLGDPSGTVSTGYNVQTQQKAA